MYKSNYRTLIAAFSFALILLAFNGCKDDKKAKKNEVSFEAMESPAFSADSTYAFIEKQLSFGYRVPGTPEHAACKDWMVSKLKGYGAEVIVQDFKASFLTVKDASSYNIIASFNPNATKRVLLAAHWDSRLIAEKDSNPDMKNKPIMGADDGASGTAALIEMARIIKANPLTYIGIDIILFDAEDQGNSSVTESWCLGSQYWSRNPHKEGYFASHGILLDMIGAKGAQFGYEAFSEGSAGRELKKLWDLAEFLGYKDLFVRTKTGPITDDHYYVMANRGIPTVDIINRPLITPHGFGHYHHTHKDDITIIDKDVLAKVGHVVSQVVYREDNGKY